jgi:pimeloyl-ACP methyl ester carboxylesterase
MSAPAVISVNGRRTRVRIEGDPADPPMLLLHGVGRSLEDWAPQYPRLAGSHRTIALDVPGFGFSTLNEPATLKVLARGVIDTLDTLGERRPLHVVGNSLGGAIALQLLVLDPYRVASLALVNSVGFDAEVALPLRLLAMPVLGRLATRRITRTSARFSERMIYADPKLATKDRIEHALAIARQPDAGVAMLETTRELVAGRGIKPRWRAELIAAAAKHPQHFDHLGRPRPYPATASSRLRPPAIPARADTSVHRRRSRAADRMPRRIRRPRPRICRRHNGLRSPSQVTPRPISTRRYLHRPVYILDIGV